MATQYLNLNQIGNNLTIQRLNLAVPTQQRTGFTELLMSDVPNSSLKKSVKLTYLKNSTNSHLFFKSPCLQNVAFSFKKCMCVERFKKEFCVKVRFLLCSGFWAQDLFFDLFSFIFSICTRQTILSVCPQVKISTQVLEYDKWVLLDFFHLNTNSKKGCQPFSSFAFILSIFYALTIQNSIGNPAFSWRKSFYKQKDAFALFKNKYSTFLFSLFTTSMLKSSATLFSPGVLPTENLKFSCQGLQVFFQRNLKYFEKMNFSSNLILPLLTKTPAPQTQIGASSDFSLFEKSSKINQTDSYLYFLKYLFYLNSESILKVSKINSTIYKFRAILLFSLFSQFCFSITLPSLISHLQLKALPKFSGSILNLNNSKYSLKNFGQWPNFQEKPTVSKNSFVLVKNSLKSYLPFFCLFFHDSNQNRDIIFLTKSNLKNENGFKHILTRYFLWLEQNLYIDIHRKFKEDSRNFFQFYEIFNVIESNSNIPKKQVNSRKMKKIKSRSSEDFFVLNVQKVLKHSSNISQENLVSKLTSVYYAFVYVSKETWNLKDIKTLEKKIFTLLWQWAYLRHTNKAKLWIRAKYFHRWNSKKMVFGFYKKILKLPTSRQTLQLVYLPWISQILYHLLKALEFKTSEEGTVKK